MCQRSHLLCFLPPYILDHMANSDDPQVRTHAIANIRAAVAVRAVRSVVQPSMFHSAMAIPNATKKRVIYDAKNTVNLPGTLVLTEGGPVSADPAVSEAYNFSGDTYDFYKKVFGRNSLDDLGMPLTSSVHVSDEFGDPLDNAFWNGWQMAYGDGDGVVFTRFSKSLDVVAHELTHGVQSFTSNLLYKGQSGALNEHFSDVFGILVRQWKKGETAINANWVIGSDILIPAATRRGIRDMEHPGTAFTNDPHLGTDRQPGNMKQLFTGSADNGGVHMNSGIPNRAFVLAAKAIGGNAWDVTGRIWYDTMLQLRSNSNFSNCAKISVQIATHIGANEGKAVRDAWKAVGIKA